MRQMCLSFRGYVLELVHFEELHRRMNYQLILNVLVDVGLIQRCSLGITFVTLQWWHSVIP